MYMFFLKMKAYPIKALFKNFSLYSSLSGLRIFIIFCLNYSDNLPARILGSNSWFGLNVLMSNYFRNRTSCDTAYIMLITPLFPVACRIKFRLFSLEFLAVYKLGLPSFIHSTTIYCTLTLCEEW